VKPLFDRIHVWLAANAPEILAGLRPGATEGAIKATESEMGLALPEEARACYRIHDGQEVAPGGTPLDFLGGLAWNSLTAMLDARRAQAELASRGDFVMHEGTTHAYLVKPRYHPKWVPLFQGGLHGGMVYEGLDLSTEPVGQVMLWLSESDHRGVLASSFREWLTTFIDQLDAGNWSHVPGRGLTWTSSE
jgi:cell wall assembly regulator SMI1